MKAVGAAAVCLCLLACDRKPEPAPAPNPPPKAVVQVPLPAPPAPQVVPPPQEAPKPEPRFEKKVALQVTRSTWRDRKPYDIVGPVREKLAAAGIQALPKNAKVRDALLEIRYRESKGTGYSFGGFPGDTPSDYGTEVEFDVALTAAGSDEVLLELSASTAPPGMVQGDVYGASLDAFRDAAAWRYLEDFVGSALGIKACFPKLLPAAIARETRETVLGLIERAGYRPADVRERVFLAVAREEYDRCAEMGKPAVAPLLEVFGMLGWNEGADRILDSLVSIGDPSAGAPILQKLRDRNTTIWMENTDEVVALIEALGKLGDASALPDLDELAKKKKPASEEEFVEETPEEVVKAAKAAAGEIRKRDRNK